jgi:hypothetical protein
LRGGDTRRVHHQGYQSELILLAIEDISNLHNTIPASRNTGYGVPPIPAFALQGEGETMNRKWLKRLGIAGGALVIAVVAVGLAGKYWLAPFVVRQQISAALRERWDGHLAIGAINLNWKGPSYLRGVTLRDAAGREWVRAGSVKLTPRNWPGLHPVLCEVEVENLDLQGYFTSGTLQLPIKPGPPQQGKTEYMDLRAITIRNMSIGNIAEGNAKAACGGLELTVRRDGESHRIEMKRMINAPEEELLVSGTVKGESLETDLNVVMKHAFAQKEATAIFAALHAPFVTQADGKMDVKLDLRGRLRDLPSLSTVRISGAITLRDASVSYARGPLMTDLKGEVRFDGQGPPSAVAKWSALFCKGRTKGELSANALDDGTVKYRYREDARGVSFDEWSKLFSDSQQIHKGELQYIYVVDGHTGGSEKAVGRGYIYLTDAHLGDVPLLVGLFDFVGLSGLNALQSTDVEATFATKGLLVTVSKARVANAVAAIDVEPGGLVDIEKQNLDLYAIVAPVKLVHDVLAMIPLVKLIVRVQERLVRVRIHGDWNAAPASLISKEPLKDIGEGTVDFLRGVVSSGGRLGKTLYKEFDERLVP